MGNEVDYYDVQSMVEGEASDRRNADRELRELIDLRVRELNEEFAEVHRHLARMREGLAVLDSVALGPMA